jgi:hypothetical protein
MTRYLVKHRDNLIFLVPLFVLLLVLFVIVCCYCFRWSENFKGRDHLEDLGVDVKILLELRVGRRELDSYGSL